MLHLGSDSGDEVVWPAAARGAQRDPLAGPRRRRVRARRWRSSSMRWPAPA